MDFLYKREVNKSVLYDGFGIDREYIPIFSSRLGEMKRGEERTITLIFNGKPYFAILRNLNNPENRRKNDAYQIRYSHSSELVKALQAEYSKTYSFIRNEYALREKGSRKRILIPEDYKEYLVLYASEKPGVFLCESIHTDEFEALRAIASEQNERVFEAEFNYDVTDDTAGLNEKVTIRKVRKLNRKIGDSLKQLYGYRCQICGAMIGENYGSHIAEAHHIDYFVNSLNNDMSNQLIVCPNHHSIIHDRNPVFDRKKLVYQYPNGLVEGLKLNKHLLPKQ